VHQLENSKQFMLLGNPAFEKHDAVCSTQDETASRQESLSVKTGRGVEHQFPHLYSQVGVGPTVYVDVQRDAVVFVVDVAGFVDEGFAVVVQLVDMVELRVELGGLEGVVEVVQVVLLFVVVTEEEVVELDVELVVVLCERY
jgi:hypothetical protein